MTIPASVQTFIMSEADAADIERIFDLARNRQKTLRQQRALSVTEGSLVLLDGLSPKVLNGLGGQVKTIRGNNGDVLLDQISTRVLARSRSRYSFSAQLADRASEGYLLTGVPLGCCTLQED